MLSTAGRGMKKPPAPAGGFRLALCLVHPPAACAYVGQGGGRRYHPVPPDAHCAANFSLLAPAADRDARNAVPVGCLFGRQQVGHQ